ncbi:unnamed protein product [Angiostrongylus costaricensis]|uniref:Peptidase M12A domain-containing protein n=1 Tax=Angiostrongylus costaricensis TaxID=334426 RepID=A0A0R3PGF6_ANGCS|nr:unnamed protein product [Angiostrongylus costaricensis]
MFVDFVHALFSEASTEVRSQTTENEAALSAHPQRSMPEPDDQRLFWNFRGTCENIGRSASGSVSGCSSSCPALVSLDPVRLAVLIAVIVIIAIVDIPSEELLDSVQNLKLLEGDIFGMPNVGESTLRRFRDDPAIDEEAVFSRPYYSALNLITYPEKLWTNGQVPYVLEEGMTTE